MATSEDPRNPNDWRTESRFYRKRPGLGWLLALILVPLLLAAIGLGLKGSDSDDDTDAAPASTSAEATSAQPSQSPGAPAGGAAALAPLAFARSGNDVTVTGEVPSDDAKTKLIDTVKSEVGSDVNVVDKVTVKDGVQTADPASLGALLKAGSDVKDFDYAYSDNAVTLRGTAPSDEVKNAVADRAKAAWPNARIDNQIRVGAAAGACPPSQAEVDRLLKDNPVRFATNGFSVAPGAQRALNQIADKLKACPAAKAVVTGYTDSSGNDAINNPLSENRAKSVADFLRARGVTAADVSAEGLGDADPIADNATPEGRAQNRRVEIKVN